MIQDNNYVEKVSKNKLYKLGYTQYLHYWHTNKDQTHILNIIKKNFNQDTEWVYTRKKDKTELFHIIIYTRKNKINDIDKI